MFDVIIGNPPYQDSKKNKKGSLWREFILNSFPLVKEHGIISFITPTSWMSGTDENGNKKRKEINTIFSNNDLLYLNLDNGSHFNIGSEISVYIIKKSKTIGLKTEVIANNLISFLDLKNFLFLPKDLNKTSYSIINKVFNNSILKKPFTAKYCVGYPKKEGLLEYKIYNTGGKFGSSSILPKNANIKKLLVSISGYLNPIFDNGIYGTSINTYWSEMNDKEAIIYIKALNHSLFKYIFKTCKYSGFNNITILKKFPKIENNSLYEYFNLTQEEIDYIKVNI